MHLHLNLKTTAEWLRVGSARSLVGLGRPWDGGEAEAEAEAAG